MLASHDQAWHASLIQELNINYPPEIPGFAGQTLKNYHFFYDLIIANQLQLFGGSVFYYIEVIYPILISLFYGISIYRVISYITKSKYIHYLTIFLAYFSHSLIYLYHNLSNNPQMLIVFDQPAIFLYNQQTVLSISVILYLLILISKIKTKFNITLNLASISLVTFLLSLKIYAYITIVIFLIFLFIFRMVKSNFNLKKNLNLIFIAICSISLSLAIVLLNYQLGQSFLHFQPGWIVTEYINRNIYPFFPQD